MTNPSDFDLRTATRAEYDAAKADIIRAGIQRAITPRTPQPDPAQPSPPSPTGAELGNTSSGAATPAVVPGRFQRVPALTMTPSAYAVALANAAPGYRRR